MSKPWEQKWTQGRNNWSIRDSSNDVQRAHVFTDDQTASEADDVARLIAAAPDMARALLEVASEDASLSVDGMACWCTRQGRERMRDSGVIRHEGFCDRARAALRKAGVHL